MRSRALVGLAVAGTALLAACGHSSNGSAGATPAVITPASTSGPVRTGHTALGDVLVDANGRTLYGFTDDTNGTSTCDGACASIWPPLEVQAGWTARGNTSPAGLHTVMRSDGHLQLAVGKWPLYLFTGDHAAGDTKGQGVEKFFVVHPDGTLLTNASTPSPATEATTGY